MNNQREDGANQRMSELLLTKIRNWSSAADLETFHNVIMVFDSVPAIIVLQFLLWKSNVCEIVCVCVCPQTHSKREREQKKGDGGVRLERDGMILEKCAHVLSIYIYETSR